MEGGGRIGRVGRRGFRCVGGEEAIVYHHYRGESNCTTSTSTTYGEWQLVLGLSLVGSVRSHIVCAILHTAAGCSPGSTYSIA